MLQPQRPAFVRRTGARPALGGRARGLLAVAVVVGVVPGLAPLPGRAGSPPPGEPPLPLTVKMQLFELTTTPTPARAACVDGERLRAVVRQATDYVGEIVLYAGERLRSRLPEQEAVCLCLGQLGRTVGAAAPASAVEINRVLAGLAPECGPFAIQGIDLRIGGSGGEPGVATRAAGLPAAPGQDGRCGGGAGCATPLLRPSSGAVGPTSVHGDG